MTRYVIGRNFRVAGDQTLYYGEIAPDEIAESPNLYALLSSHYLYALPDDGDGAWLPPHLYSQVANVQLKRGFIKEGEQPNMGINWTKPPQVERSEELLDLEAESRAENQARAELRAQSVIERERVFRLSPRPVELPPEQVLIDSKRGEAMSSGVEHIIPVEDVEVPEQVVNADPQDDRPVRFDDDDDDDDNHLSKAELQSRARSWNEDHPDDKISPNQNKPQLEKALEQRGAL